MIPKVLLLQLVEIATLLVVELSSLQVSVNYIDSLLEMRHLLLLPLLLDL